MQQPDFYKEVIVNEFNEASARKFREDVMNIAKMGPDIPIIVYIDSYGGEVYSLASMVGTMRSVPNKFVTVCIGKAMSCGAILLSMGDYRFVEEHSQVLIHEISSGVIGNVHDIINEADSVKKLNEYWMDALAKRCGLSGYDELKKIIRDNMGRDLYLNAQEAKKFGIADFIGTPMLAPIVNWALSNSNESDPVTDKNKPNDEADDIMKAINKAMKQPRKSKKTKKKK